MTPFITKRDYKPSEGLSITQLSLAIPDQSLSIRDVLKRHSQGLAVQGDPRNPIFNDDLGQIMVENMDRVEREQYLQQVRENIAWIREALAAEANKKAEAAQKEADRKKYDEWAAEAAKTKAAEETSVN